MAFKTELKTRVMLLFLSALSVLQRIKVYFGLLDIKYGLIGYFSHKGMPLQPFLHKLDRIVACQQYSNFRPDDVILLTYPKSGTHFIGEIIASIYKEAGLIKTSGMSAIVSLESQPPAIFHSRKSGEGGVMSDIEAAISPRIIVTHFSWSFLPQDVRNGNVKVIHGMRNPKDVVCSFYAFLSKMGVLHQITWKEFVLRFIEGNVLYGEYFKFIKEWYPHRNHQNMLNLQYEDLIHDMRGNIKKVAEFVGVELTAEQIDRVVAATTFNNMRQSMGKKHPVFRKGKAGSWKSELTVEQNEMMDEWVKNGMEGLEDFHIRYD